MPGWSGIQVLNDVDPGQAAFAYANAGLKVAPAHSVYSVNDRLMCTCGDENCDRRGKHPRAPWKTEATNDEDKIKEWWTRSPGSNPIIVTGSRSGLIVLDLDVKDLVIDDRPIHVDGAQELDQWLENNCPDWSVARFVAEGLAAQTGGGGTHLYLRNPGGVRTVVDWLPGTDVKADGGYVLAPPAQTDKGRYRWISDGDPLEVPETLAAALKIAKGHPGVRGSRSGDQVDFDYAEAKKIGPPPGARDEFFNMYTFELRKKGWSLDDATAEIRRLWELTPGGGIAGNEPYPWDVALEKITRIWGDEAITVEPKVTEEQQAWANRQGTPPSPPPAEPADQEPINKDEEPQVENTESASSSNVVPISDAPSWNSDDPDADARTRQEGSGAGSGGSGGGGDNDDGTGGPPPQEGPGDPYRFETQLTESGAAERFVRRFQSALIHVPGLGWHRWDGNRWKLHDSVALHWTRYTIEDLADEQRQHAGDDQTQAAYTQFIKSTSSSKIRSGIVNLARVDDRIERQIDELDSDPWLFVTKNGTLDLRDGYLKPTSDPGDFCTRQAGVAYDEDAACPEWIQHVWTISATRTGQYDPELYSFLQRWAGYTLTGLVSEQKFPFLYGDGNNGKNVFVETLMRVMGSYSQVGSAKLLVGMGQEHETVIADLAGPRMVFIDETPKGRINQSRVKQLTGSGKIRARKIAKDSFEFDARFKLWIAGNNKPHVADTSDGFWRRLDLIPFDQVIPADKRVRDYDSILVKKEGSGILNWCLEGLTAYRTIGLAPPTRVDQAKQIYRDEENAFGQFISDTFDRTPGRDPMWLPNKVLHTLYERWCREQGIERIESMQRITGDLERNGFQRDPKVYRVKFTYGGSKTTRGWWGPPPLELIPSELTWA